MKKFLKVCGLLVIGIAILMISQSVLATPLTIDEIVYQTATGLDPDKLSGTADAAYSSGVLTITLTNTSQDLGIIDKDAAALLTGIGFNLPPGVSITAGSVALNGSTVVNAPGSYNLQATWGWGEGGSPFQTDHYVTGSIGFDASTMQSAITHDFTETATPTANVDGPGWGLLSTNQSSFGSGLPAIENTIVISLNLSGYSGNQADLINFINAGDVAIAFGSSNAVPEPSTLLLLGVGLIGLGLLGRKKFKTK